MPSIAVERLVGARGLANRVPLDLEVDPHVLAEARVVVDDEDERAGGGTARPRPLEERLEVAPPVAPVAARRVERGHAALVGPLPDRRLSDAEELRSLAERQPVRLGRRRPPARVRHAEKVAKAFAI